MYKLRTITPRTKTNGKRLVASKKNKAERRDRGKKQLQKLINDANDKEKKKRSPSEETGMLNHCEKDPSLWGGEKHQTCVVTRSFHAPRRGNTKIERAVPPCGEALS